MIEKERKNVNNILYKLFFTLKSSPQSSATVAKQNQLIFEVIYIYWTNSFFLFLRFIFLKCMIRSDLASGYYIEL